MATITKTFGPAPNLLMTWGRGMLISPQSSTVNGSIEKITLSFYYAHNSNTTVNTTLRVFNKVSLTNWNDYSSYLKEDNATTTNYYSSNNYVASNFTCLAEKSVTLTRQANGKETNQITVTISGNELKNINLSSWCKRLYFGIIDKENPAQNNVWWWGYNLSAEMTITYSQESTGSLDETTVNLGGTSTFTISSNNSSYNHKVRWICGSNSIEKTFNPGETTKEITIPTSWGSNFPTKESYSGSVTLKTYSGSTQIGSTKTYSITYKVPAYTPTISASITSYTHDDNLFSNFSNKNILTPKTTATFKIKTESSYGATISSVITKANNSSGSIISNGSSFSFRGNISASIFYIIVTDSRGHSGNSTYKLEKTAYDPPSLTSVSARRTSDSAGTTTDESAGLYAAVTPVYKPGSSPVGTNNTNTTTCTVTINDKSFSNVSSGTTKTLEKFTLDSSWSYTVTLKDTAGTKITKTGVINSVKYLLHFRYKKQSLGIGCAAPDIDSQLDIAWPVNLQKGLTAALPVDFGGTGAISKEGACESIGAVKKSGDTMTGTLYAPFCRIYKSDWPALSFGPNKSTETGSIYQAISSHRVGISQIAENSSYAENYLFPTPNTQTEAKWYSVLTSKNAVTIPQGGTGATKAADARVNLGTDDAANITKGKLAAARLPLATGHTTINSNTAKTITHNLNRVPKIIATYSKEGENVSGDWGSIKIYDKNTTTAKIIIGGASSDTEREIDWIAI